MVRVLAEFQGTWYNYDVAGSRVARETWQLSCKD